MSLAESLAQGSSLTNRQIESLSVYLRVAAGEIKLREAAGLVSSSRTKGSLDKQISVGSYYRTVEQARRNVRQSLVSVLVALQLGVIKLEDVRRLFELAALGGRELSEDEVSRVVDLLKVLLDRMIL